MPKAEVTVYLSLGSNLGERAKNLDGALDMLAEKLTIERVSSVYDTAPVGNKDQPRFLNVVCRGRTSLSPEDLLKLAKEIEADMGRQPGPVNSPRPIDIDILFYGDMVISSPALTIPHLRMDERAFVLVPLAEIAPEAVYPPDGRRVRDMLAALKDTQDVLRWKQNGMPSRNKDQDKYQTPGDYHV